MSEIIKKILLLALPASGKSEVRKFMAGLDEDECGRDFHMGPTVQLDDFPYVHFMRRVDDELRRMGGEGVYFQAADRPFADPWDWGTLIELLNEDYDDLVNARAAEPESAARHMFDRMDSAAQRAGARKKLTGLPGDLQGAVSDALEAEARGILRDKYAEYPDTMEGRTMVMEFARGGADGSSLPLEPPFGYAHSLSLLSHEVLDECAILYIWVTPEESRRKNDDRSDPNDPGSILHHGVPMPVMMGDYGCDDMEWLIEASDKPDTVRVESRGRVFHIPVARFDNRVDKTTFVRKDRSDWNDDEVNALHNGLKDAMGRLHSV